VFLKFALNNFIVQQFHQISDEGWAAFRRKLKRVLLVIADLHFIVLALILVLLVRLIRPLLLIRFGYFNSSIIGSFVHEAEYYLSKKDYEKTKSIDLFYYRYKYESHRKPSNEQWDIMVRRHIHVSPFVSYLYTANQLLPMGKVHSITYETGNNYWMDPENAMSQTNQHIRFTDVENERGLKFLQEIGHKQDELFICLIVRDSAYKEKYQDWKKDWSYHNFRDSDIDTYEEVSLALAEKGYWVFRMGKVVKKPLNLSHPRILDYVNTKYRSDFLDIWLMANCHFCITGNGGITEVARIFRRPLVQVNAIPFCDLRMVPSLCISIPKKLTWRENNIPLSFSEQMTHNYHRHSEYKNAKIKIIDSTAREITEAVMEMEGRLNGTWKDSDEDDPLQKLYWQRFKVKKVLKLHISESINLIQFLPVIIGLLLWEQLFVFPSSLQSAAS